MMLGQERLGENSDSAGINCIRLSLSDVHGACMMSVASDFEWKETYRARLNGLESVLASLIDLLIARDADLGSDLSRRLVSLEVLMREQNSHLASLKTVRRFQVLVEEEAQTSAAAWQASGATEKLYVFDS